LVDNWLLDREQTAASNPRTGACAAMFELRKSFHFEASHVLTHHNGQCARLHGHSYVLTLVLRGSSLHRTGPEENMLCDFSDISAAAKGIIASHLDHHHLNDTLKTQSPTAEYIARWVFDALLPALPALREVELRETATAVVVYRPSRRRRAALLAAIGGQSAETASYVRDNEDAGDASSSDDSADGTTHSHVNGDKIGNGICADLASNAPVSRAINPPIAR
jgi:6-pyruvoyltetrahydropterin/6-carboxytetrahydropterin synthase